MRTQPTLALPSKYSAGYLSALARSLGLSARLVLSYSVIASTVVLLSTAAQAQTTVPGKIPGQFAVSPSGAATYSIPIQVPPGIAGMQPKLSLEYNSQAGNGIMGMGWSLAGLSSITRCPRTVAQDGVRGSINYDWNDRYCLDGQRLILTDANGTKVSYESGLGSEYRTEIESFSQIVPIGQAGNGPASFTVRTKAGLTMVYGSTDTSRIEAQGKVATVATWALDKITDIKGNTMTVSYYEDTINPYFYPTRIEYSGNLVVFNYTNPGNILARPDIVSGYNAGSLSTMALRLNNIVTFTGATASATTKLQYTQSLGIKRSILSSILLCDGAGSSCLAPTNTTYADGNFNGFNIGAAFPNNGYGVGSNNFKFLNGDFNGDGKTDLVHIVNNDYIHVWLSNGDGTFSIQQRFSPWAGYGIGTNNYRFETGDFNGDGKTDLIHFVNNDYVHVWLSNGDGTFTLQQTFPNNGYAVGSNNYKFLSGDFNGDGKTDLAHIVNNDYIHVWLSNGDGTFSVQQQFSPWAGYGVGSNNYRFETGDFNGDGKTDLLHFVNNDYALVWLSNGDGTFSVQKAISNDGYAVGSNNYKYLIGDFNGDGKTDLIHVVNNDYVHVWLSKGDGTFSVQQQFSPWAGYGVGSNNYRFETGDFNGDGKSDLIHFVNNDYALVWLSNGDGTFRIQQAISNSGYAVGSNNYQYLLGDFNGDGKTDLTHLVNNNYVLVWSASPATASDVITKVQAGAASGTSFSYEAITRGNYVKDASATYPKLDLQIPLYVVSQVDTSNGVGGVNSVQYSYGGLKAEQGTGRGMLGFRWMQSKELSTGIETRTEYLQDWPYTGMPVKSETRLAGYGNAGLLKRSTSTPDCKMPQTGIACNAPPPPCTGSSWSCRLNRATYLFNNSNRYFPYIANSLEESWELNGGQALPTLTTSTQYGISPGDSQLWGDPLTITVSTSDGASKVAVNEYEPAIVTGGSWILGRLKKATVTSISPTADLGIGTVAGGVTVGLPPPTPPTPAQLKAAKAVLPAILSLLFED